VEDRAIPGHWEGDLLRGSRNSHSATLVERHSRFTALVKVPSKDTAAVVAALTRHVRKLPAALRRSNLGSRAGDGQTQKPYSGHGCERCTSVIRRVPGNAARTKTQMGCYDHTSRRKQTSATLPSRIRTK
jgi:hypothetical protein